MSMYAVNPTTYPEGFCNMLLGYGIIPRLALSSPDPTQLTIIETIERESWEAERFQAKARISFAISYLSGPKGNEASALLTNLPPGPPVII